MLEKMAEFFENRIDSYEDHMLSIPHIKNGYIKLAELIPNNSRHLLDLGCGTGLELVEIYKKFPEINITGIDISQKMLDELNKKFVDKNIKLINSNYLEYDFGKNTFDTIISYETLHHFEYGEKIRLYKKLFNALTQNGQYIECDYMVFSQAEEDFYFSENKRLRIENGIESDELFHYDTPCTVENQMKMLREAGFKNVTEEWKEENTVIIVSKK